MKTNGLIDVEILWNGARSHPSGPYLLVELDPVVARPVPFRSIYHLEAEDIEAILTAAQGGERHPSIARRFHLSTSTVDTLVQAAKEQA